MHLQGGQRSLVAVCVPAQGDMHSENTHSKITNRLTTTVTGAA